MSAAAKDIIITVDSTTGFFPGCYACIAHDDGAIRDGHKIIEIVDQQHLRIDANAIPMSVIIVTGPPTEGIWGTDTDGDFTLIAPRDTPSLKMYEFQTEDETP